MNVLFAGMVEGAIIGAVVGLLVGVVAAFLPGKPCPRCKQRLPKPVFRSLRACPKCGCKLNAKGRPLDDDDEGR
jgi:hypothetical protein